MTWTVGTLGVTGARSTPQNLDSLPRSGLRFTQSYNTARRWPSRACALTGYFAQEVRHDALPGVNGRTVGKRPAWAPLVPELLRPLGYRSYHSGKWHLDGNVWAGGFDHSSSITTTTGISTRGCSPEISAITVPLHLVGPPIPKVALRPDNR